MPDAAANADTPPRQQDHRERPRVCALFSNTTRHQHATRNLGAERRRRDVPEMLGFDLQPEGNVMDAFAYIAKSCRVKTAEAPKIDPRTRAQRVREHLQIVRKASAAEIAEAAGMSSQDVRSTLAYDIRSGKVRITNPGFKQSYLLVQNPPADKKTLKAIALLTGQGYVVQGLVAKEIKP
jgi:hypothetical protein